MSPINCLLEFRLKWLSVAMLKARSEASRQFVSNFIFYAELRFALLASLRSASFCGNQVNLFSTFSKMVKFFQGRRDGHICLTKLSMSRLDKLKSVFF